VLNKEIKEYIDRSVLCWLATASSDNVPNVSPKEAFKAFGDDSIIIANIASPQTIKNIKENNQVCLSFIEVFVQKGFQLKGIAEIITEEHEEYKAMKNSLEEFTQGAFPFKSITRIKVEKVKKIIAPSYKLFPDISEEEKIVEAKKSYGV